ncbi:hypothetical protein P8625_44 [Verrucomicrobia phage P8625]|uniref:hypothetical protein n=1 Tax=Verrucomicrobia phage P8625 TaxID=1636271 RepID=UPI0005FEB73E|nr:hypothetical protein AWI59_gp44 [Verrucomicrobia phage P8625]AKA60295.1 hypothetical protein P8625_44 [Verrucomicrobia phage P8625]
MLTRDTGAPETEKIWLESGKMEVGDAECYLRRFAEKMERERNEARKECELWRGRFCDERIRFPWENMKVCDGCSEERTKDVHTTA